MIEVLHGGLLTTLQDQGRRGHAAVGVGQAGPMDSVCALLANWLAGNEADAALLEISLGGPRLRFARDACIALTGADCAAELDGAPLPAWRPVPVSAGAVLDCRRLLRGARAYLAVSGGIAAANVLGSRSMDVNAGLGPNAGRPLHSGDTLPLADAPALQLRRAPRWSLAPRPWFDPSPLRLLRLLRGSHYAALDAASQHALTSTPFRIAAESNRVGARLQGARLQLQQPLELVSAAVTTGTVQLPPGGQPIMLGAEHPTTGGYPRIAHLITVDQPHLAQYRPGETLRFRLVEPEEADQLRRRREQALARLHDILRQRLRENACDAWT